MNKSKDKCEFQISKEMYEEACLEDDLCEGIKILKKRDEFIKKTTLKKTIDKIVQEINERFGKEVVVMYNKDIKEDDKA